jgi:hypothetical protein
MTLRHHKLLLGAALAVRCAFGQFDQISHPPPVPGEDAVIRIDRPNPKARSTDYPSITFQPGDNVTIRSGGCVQSGGAGDTWHRYVNPSGPNADRLYHGLITIPFATGTLDRILTHWNRTVHVADSVPPGARIHLQLGFEDDGYGDNSYNDHDDGPGGQCKGPEGQAAWVELHIVHHSAAPTSSLLSWDLEFPQFDDNGIPLNPDWHSNVAKTGFPDPGACRWPWQGGSAKNCTTQITNIDFDPNAGYTFYNPIKMAECASCSVCQSFSPNEGFGGHANWTAATYTGSVFWESKAAPGLDDEYSVNLVTPNAAGATAARSDGVHVEFDSDETIDTLTNDDFQIPFFLQFRSAVDSGDSQAHDFLDGKDMIVTGLFGVDFAHTPGGESHPAWSVAIHANEDPADDTWAFFARNWGDEGYCSESQHYINYLDAIYMLRIPWPAGATSGFPNGNTIAITDSGITMDDPVFDPATRTVIVTFRNLPDATKHGIIGGELHFTWQGATPRQRQRILNSRRPAPNPPDKAEALKNSLVSRMTPAQRQIYSTNSPKIAAGPRRPASKVAIHTGAASAITMSPGTAARIRRVAPGRRPTITAVRDAADVQRKNAEIEAIRKAYGGTIPIQR